MQFFAVEELLEPIAFQGIRKRNVVRTLCRSSFHFHFFLYWDTAAQRNHLSLQKYIQSVQTGCLLSRLLGFLSVIRVVFIVLQQAAGADVGSVAPGPCMVSSFVPGQSPRLPFGWCFSHLVSIPSIENTGCFMHGHLAHTPGGSTAHTVCVFLWWTQGSLIETPPDRQLRITHVCVAKHAMQTKPSVTVYSDLGFSLYGLFFNFIVEMHENPMCCLVTRASGSFWILMWSKHHHSTQPTNQHPMGPVTMNRMTVTLHRLCLKCGILCSPLWSGERSCGIVFKCVFGVRQRDAVYMFGLIVIWSCSLSFQVYILMQKTLLRSWSVPHLPFHLLVSRYELMLVAMTLVVMRGWPRGMDICMSIRYLFSSLIRSKNEYRTAAVRSNANRIVASFPPPISNPKKMIKFYLHISFPVVYLMKQSYEIDATFLEICSRKHVTVQTETEDECILPRWMFAADDADVQFSIKLVNHCTLCWSYFLFGSKKYQNRVQWLWWRKPTYLDTPHGQRQPSHHGSTHRDPGLLSVRQLSPTKRSHPIHCWWECFYVDWVSKMRLHCLPGSLSTMQIESTNE